MVGSGTSGGSGVGTGKAGGVVGVSGASWDDDGWAGLGWRWTEQSSHSYLFSQPTRGAVFV